MVVFTTAGRESHQHSSGLCLELRLCCWGCIRRWRWHGSGGVQCYYFGRVFASSWTWQCWVRGHSWGVLRKCWPSTWPREAWGHRRVLVYLSLVVSIVMSWHGTGYSPGTTSLVDALNTGHSLFAQPLSSWLWGKRLASTGNGDAGCSPWVTVAFSLLTVGLRNIWKVKGSSSGRASRTSGLGCLALNCC